jgi:hypothetical protein
MTSYDRSDIVLATLPFSDFTGMKQRPAVVVSARVASASVQSKKANAMNVRMDGTDFMHTFYSD